MALVDALANLGAIGQGYVKTQDELSRMRQREQLANLEALQYNKLNQQFQQQQNVGNLAGSSLSDALAALPQMRQQQQAPPITPMQQAAPQQPVPQQQAGPQANLANFNFGNIKVPGSSDTYQKFSSPQEGLDAISNQIATYQGKYGLNTEADIINRYAPQSDPGNRGKPLVSDAAKVSGLDPSTPYDFSKGSPANQALTKAILTQEQGGKRAQQIMEGTIGQTAVAQAQSVPVPLVKGAAGVSRQALTEVDPADYGRATLTAINDAVDKHGASASPMEKLLAVQQLQKLLLPEDQMMFKAYMAQSQQGFRAALAEYNQGQINQRTQTTQQKIGERQQIGIAAGQQKQERAIQAKQEQAGGPETIDPVAKAIANYQQAPLTGWSMRSPWGQQVMAKVYEQNPNYQATQFGARQSAARAFASGRQSDTTRSMSVAIDHLQTAQDLGDALQNGDVKLMNRAKNALKDQFGYEGPPDFNTAKMIVSDEVTKAVAGGTLSMTERMALGDQLSVASSPEALKGVITTLKTLLGGQLRGLERQYETGTGQSKEEFEKKLSPQAKEQLQPKGEPSPGTTMEGKGGKMYTFKGGDPHDPNNWTESPAGSEPVQQ